MSNIFRDLIYQKLQSAKTSFDRKGLGMSELTDPPFDTREDHSVTTPITKHEGNKYIRKIVGCTYLTDSAKSKDGMHEYPMIEVDVYAVIMAFGITCPAQQHALKKLLAAGRRGKGDRQADLKGAIAAINRAIELDKTAHVYEDDNHV